MAGETVVYNKVKFNLKNVHYAKKSSTGYSTPVSIPGAVSLSLSPTGEETAFYADGIKYFKTNSNNGYEGDLEIAKITDTFRKDILGETEDTNKVLTENATALPSEFALGFEVDGDASGTKFWYYSCVAARPSHEAKTSEESITPDTDKLTLTISPLADGKVRAKTTEETTASTVSGWFTSVYTGPTPSPGS